ncbi:MAG: hypothetical protein CSB48_01290 [Proteobacteria bacterium]|nr:MAG: hypothetical protein CSB48_01290 [Pseudomonadota bacterium]
MSRLLRSRFVEASLATLLFGLSLFSYGEERIYGEERSVGLIEEIKWHGFLSQSFILTDENDFLGTSTNGSFKFSSAGLGASWKPCNSIQLSAQALYKQIGNTKPKGTNLDYAILDWAIVDQFDRGFGLRGGRLMNAYGFYNETRDVAATRPSILLPESTYIDYLQFLFRSSDSIGLYARSEMGEGTLSFNTNIGRPLVYEEVVRVIMGGLPGKSATGRIGKNRLLVSQLGYEDARGQWRSALTYVLYRGNYEVGPEDILREGKITSSQLMLSFEYNWDELQLITEAFRRNLSITDALPFTIYDEHLGYYFQVGYQFEHGLKPYMRYDAVFLDKDDRQGLLFEAGRRGPAAFAFAKDITVGMSYTPSFNWNFGVEFHLVDGDYWVPAVENPDPLRQKRYWNMFLAQAAYRF